MQWLVWGVGGGGCKWAVWCALCIHELCVLCVVRVFGCCLLCMCALVWLGGLRRGGGVEVAFGGWRRVLRFGLKERSGFGGVWGVGLAYSLLTPCIVHSRLFVNMRPPPPPPSFLLNCGGAVLADSAVPPTHPPPLSSSFPVVLVQFWQGVSTHATTPGLVRLDCVPLSSRTAEEVRRVHACVFVGVLGVCGCACVLGVYVYVFFLCVCVCECVGEA